MNWLIVVSVVVAWLVTRVVVDGGIRRAISTSGVVMVSEAIDFGLFDSKYVSFSNGDQLRLCLANWRQEMRSYDEDKTSKPVLVFDVFAVGRDEYPKGEKLFVTGARSFVRGVKPLIERAEAENRKQIHVIVKYQDKTYTVVDIDR